MTRLWLLPRGGTARGDRLPLRELEVELRAELAAAEAAVRFARDRYAGALTDPARPAAGMGLLADARRIAQARVDGCRRALARVEQGLAGGYATSSQREEPSR